MKKENQERGIREGGVIVRLMTLVLPFSNLLIRENELNYTERQCEVLALVIRRIQARL